MFSAFVLLLTAAAAAAWAQSSPDPEIDRYVRAEMARRSISVLALVG